MRERRAFRRGDKRVLKTLAQWDRHTKPQGGERAYKLDPLPKTIARAFADFLFGEDPKVTHSDQENYDRIIEENQLPSELHRAERWAVSEGEVWWKIHVDKGAADAPLIEWTSRLQVVPLMRGRKVLAAAFVAKVAACAESVDPDEAPKDVVYRHVELHARGTVQNFLYRGEVDKLGQSVPLTARPEVEDLPEEWKHGLDMLAGRITNDIDDNAALGDSDYDQLSDLFLDLNETATIASENVRLTAKKRLFVNGALTNQEGDLDAGEDVYQVDADGGVLGQGSDRPPITAVEYSFDAAPLKIHKDDLVETALNRVGLVKQFVDSGQEGQAESGTAIRLRFLPTVNASKGKAREWDDKLPRILSLAAQVDATGDQELGYGRNYTDLGTAPTVERGDVIPVDDSETVNDNATAVAAEIRSRRTAVRDQHPDWTEEQIDEEVAAIEEDIASGTPDLPPPPPPPDPNL